MRPFVESPFFVANPLLANAMTRLRHAVTFPGGVVVLSGGPGVGKSALLAHALAPVESDVQVLPVDLRSADPAEFHDALLDGLGASGAGPADAQPFGRLRAALLAQRTSGRQLILSLDVSGINVDLARRLLRFLHLTGEVCTPVSIVLQGPHTVHQLLDVPGLIQLRQRLSLRLKVRPLTLLETAGYVRHCLTASGENPDELLAANAPAAVYLYVAGVPRLINTLMDATLGEAQARQLSKIDDEFVRQVAEQLGWKPMGSRPSVDLPPKAPASPTRRTADRVTPRPPVPQPTPAAEALPASEATRRLLIARSADTTPPVVEAPGERRRPERGSRPPPPVPMEETDPGATGMLRLEDLDERFAESLFAEEAGHFKALATSGKTD